ncbi:MAG: NAD(P)-dependent alcohol dehydrogenase [Bacteroidia bacterium]|nr:NAD(P)-dependent alcohol dehydrogenase [Bacteroidia bacterium]MCF8426173.1 NAD(P)-dependent alcohol dehydrogenase [Bacteroidia bacterium]MCF8445521.1 NAD(P)-dependent alcohol dehydrogenase [Bacteroidia bacterium]
MQTLAYAAFDANSPLKEHTIERRELGVKDIQLEIMYSGVCHSDIHQVKNEWGATTYPIVPGHEIVGKVVAIGSEVTNYKLGDIAGVGCFVDSCRHCNPCKEGEENFCEGAVTWTYNSIPAGASMPTYGGYSKSMVVDELYALHIDPKMDLSRVAPLLCAGITTYSPLRHWNVGKGTKLAVLGLGGLGHMAVKFGVSFGADVTVLSSSENKRADAMALGAHHFVNYKNEAEANACINSFDLILDTVSAEHDLNFFMNMLKRDSKMVLVGLPSVPTEFSHRSVIGRRRSLSGSSIGGTKETQEMLDYCAEHQIYSDVEMITLPEINTAYERMLNNDVKYRFVIDLMK